MKFWTAICFAALTATAAQAQGTTAASFTAARAEWNKPFPPFRIIGNIYYVGTNELGVYLITSPKGDVLIDGGLEETVPQIEKNIQSLGFKLSDIKLILNTHAHFDHAEGIAQLKKDTGAAFDASAADKPILERGYITYGPSASIHFPPAKVDHVVRDGEVVRVGAIALTAHLTPGCTSWTLPVMENGKTYQAIDICSISVAGNPLVKNRIYPQIVSDYRASIAKLKAMHADVFLGPHAGFFDMQKKYAARKAGAPNPFIVPGEIQSFVASSEVAFDKELARQEAAQK